MNYYLLCSAACLSSLCLAQDSNYASSDVLSHINQLIGTNNGGNVFAGASLPYGMAKSVADVDGQNTGGFATDGSNVTGFSHMHDSGTGGNPSLGNFPLFPQAYCPGDILDNCNFSIETRKTNYLNDSVDATPGYFALTLDTGIRAEMTVTHHAALYHFEFPTSTPDGSPVSPLMILDLTDLAASRQNASVLVNPQTGRMTGNGTFLASFGSGSFVSYFCADFQGASIRDTGVYVNQRAGTTPKQLFVERGINAFYIQAGGIIQFHTPSPNNTISARVGVSFISSDQACEYAESELPTWNFNGTRSTAEDAWRKKLEVVSVDAGGASSDMVTSFYSGIYRAMMSPQDYTGENPLWKSSEPYFDSFYCIWDQFRAQLPLLTIVDPKELSLMYRSLIDTYKHLGWLPDCRMSLCKGFSQGGSNADVVLVDGYLKSLPGVNWEDAYAAIINDAENEPFDWAVQGRGGSMSWKNLGYIPVKDYDYLGFGVDAHSISRTLEYAYNDFCISELAKGLGHSADAAKYASRSRAWQHLYKANQTSFINATDTGFVGFWQPKYLNGTFGSEDPILCSPLDQFCSLTSNPQPTFEDSIWEYQFFVPQSMAALVTLLGGPDAFVERLDYLHTSGLTDIGNEPSFLTVFQYHYAGRPALSALRVHTYIPSAFNATTGGLPGNDDSGAMGSFVAFATSGLFPVAGQNVYLITPPFFRSVSYTSPVTNKTAKIRNTNFDASYSNVYIQSAKLNGKAYTKNWIKHEFFLEGGTLELTLGMSESKWGTRMEDLPPSYTPANVNVTARVVGGEIDMGMGKEAQGVA